MLTAIKNFFASPIYENDIEKTQDARTTHRVSLALLFLALFSTPFILLLQSPTREYALGATSFGFFIWLFTIFLVKKEKNTVAKIIILVINTSNLLGVSYAVGGFTRPAVFTTIFLVALATLLFPRQGATAYGVILTIATSLVFVLGALGLVPEPSIPDTIESNFYIFAFTLIAVIILLSIASTNSRRSLETIRQSESQLRDRNSELNQLRGALEIRVAERTADLEKRAMQLTAISEISSAILSTRERRDQLSFIANMISERLKFYHTGIFILDEDHQYAVLRAANSEGGKKMLARRHKLRIGTQGVVGFVAEKGQPRIALDVGTDSVYFDNPDLPDTHSEIALPLIISENVIGVLDVQSTETNAFHQEDLKVLTTLANQVAISLENTRLLSDAQQALEQAQIALRQYSREEWSKFTQKASHTGMLLRDSEFKLLKQTIDSTDLKTAIQSNEMVNTEQTLAVPIKVRGESIGVVGVQAKEGQRNWTREEIALVEAAADRAALALESARLLEEAQRRAIREQVIGEISDSLSRASEVENILQTTVEELGRYLPNTSNITIEMASIADGKVIGRED